MDQIRPNRTVRVSPIDHGEVFVPDRYEAAHRSDARRRRTRRTGHSRGDHRSSTATGRGSGFTRRVLAVVRRIPPGWVATYGDVAVMAGRPRAWRAVGQVMRNCRAAEVPCHRVIAAAGRVGGFSDPWLKRELLRAEGVIITGRRVRNFAVVRWTAQRRSSVKAGLT